MIKKLFILSFAFTACVSTVMADPVEVVLSDVANYIDFHAISISDPQMTNHQVTSNAPYTLKNGTILRGYIDPSTHGELTNNWVIKDGYNTSLPTPSWVGVDSLKVGTSFRAARGTTITLGAFHTTEVGKMTIYFQPNGDTQRGVSISIHGKEVAQLTGNGIKINGVRPAYAGEIDLPAGQYEAGDVIITLISNTSHIFGVNIEKFSHNSISGIYYIFDFQNFTAEVTYGDIAYSGEISIPDTVIYNGHVFAVTSIGDSAFYNCTNLTNVKIPSSITCIGNSAFLECTDLAHVTIEAVTPPTLGENVFSCNDNYSINVPCGTLDAYITAWPLCSSHITYKPLEFKYTIIGEVNIEGAGKVQLPNMCDNDIYAIPNYGYHFVQWSDSVTDNPRTIVLTQDTTFTAEFAVDTIGTCGDDNLLTWEFAADTKTLTISGEGTLNSNYTFGLEAPSNIQALLIQNGVTSLGNSAFANEENIVSLSLPDGLTAIGDSTFINCKKLKKLTIPSSVTTIGKNAFANGNRLETIILGEGIENIDVNAFANCPYILSVYAYMEYPPVIDASVFAGCGDLSYVDLYVLEDSYARYRKTAVWNSFNLKTFTPTSVEQVPSDQVQCTKVLRDGQIFILRGGKIYTLTGQEIK